MKRALKYFRTQISSGTDPMTIINEILQTIAVKNSKIGEMENKIEKLEDKISAFEGEIYDLNALLDETLLPLTKIWCETLSKASPPMLSSRYSLRKPSRRATLTTLTPSLPLS